MSLTVVYERVNCTQFPQNNVELRALLLHFNQLFLMTVVTLPNKRVSTKLNFCQEE